MKMWLAAVMSVCCAAGYAQIVPSGTYALSHGASGGELLLQRAPNGSSYRMLLHREAQVGQTVNSGRLRAR